MPIYEYRCENGHLFEVMQKIADPPVTVCETCEAPVQRVFHPVAVHFKGSGFYTTDYAKKSTVPSGSGGEDKSGSGADGSEPKKDSGSSSESKLESKSGGESTTAASKKD
jgi:putative FmdB family regulatory protein